MKLWFHRALTLAFAVVFTCQVSVERLCSSGPSAREEITRATRATFEVVGGFLDAMAAPSFAVTAFGAVVAVIIPLAMRRRGSGALGQTPAT